MSYLTEEERLRAEGYKIENVRITKVDLSMADHGCITLALCLEGRGVGVTYGGYNIGHGYLGAKEEDFSSNEKAMVYIMRIMDTIGVERFNDLKGRYARIASKGWGSTVNIIGNIIKDKWFNQEEFFKEK